MKRLLFVILILFTLIPYPAYATTATLTVNAESGYTSTVQGTQSYVGGAADYTVLNNDNGDTSYWKTASASGGFGSQWINAERAWQMTNYGGSDVISAVTVYWKHRMEPLGSALSTPFIRVAGTNYYGTDILESDAYVLSSYSWATNPAGGAWTAAAINAAYFGIYVHGTQVASFDQRTTYAYVEVTYTSSVPSVSSSAASTIAPTSALLNGTVTSDSGLTIDYYGFVWDTSDKGDPGNADPSVPPGTWTNGWKSAVGNYGENPFNHSTGATLNKGTQYYYRAAAHNSVGWAYGSAVYFTTVNDPTITTVAASPIYSTTTRVNALVTFDGLLGGGEDCTVTFVYKAGSPFANYAAILAAGGTEVAATGTYNVNETPYYDLSGLTAGTLYSFAVKIVNSTATTAYGSVLTFTTESGISDPTDLKALSTASTISLVWIKGAGAQYTLVRYSSSAYPTTTTDPGSVVGYLGTGNSVTVTGLIAGTTYYVSAWGKTGALYSAGYDTVMITTLAYDTGVPTGTIESPPSNSMWTQTPSAAKVTNIPVVSGLIDANATAYGIPLASLWYFLWVLFSVGTGIFAYNKGNQNLVLGMMVSDLLFALGAVLGLTMMWIMVVFMTIGVGFTLFGNRH